MILEDMSLKFLDVVVTPGTRIAYTYNEEETKMWIWVGKSVEFAPEHATTIKVPEHLEEGKNVWHWVAFNESDKPEIIATIENMGSEYTEDKELIED